MRQALINENEDLVQQNSRYVMRITGDDAEGCAEIGNFIDPEAKYPVIVTTSRLLSTGVDAQTCRLIVLEREVHSMTEFKQIVGRGTRVHEDTKKYYFTLIDFRKATNHFADPEFDGEPVQIYEPGDDDPVTPPDDVPPTSDEQEPIPAVPTADEQIVVDAAPPDITITPGGHGARRKYYIHGDPVTIVAERIEHLDENGNLITEGLRDYSKKTLRKRFASLDEFLKSWNAAERKDAIIEELNKEGLLFEPLAEEVGKNLDPFDLICHVAFDQPPLTRRDRVENVRKRDVFTKYGSKARAVLEALLQKYQDDGVTALDDPRILRVAPFDVMGTPVELLKQFGGRKGFEKAVHELQSALYEKAA
jgi:type I restriction enzyme R subunit